MEFFFSVVEGGTDTKCHHLWSDSAFGSTVLTLHQDLLCYNCTIIINIYQVAPITGFEKTHFCFKAFLVFYFSWHTIPSL